MKFSLLVMLTLLGLTTATSTAQAKVIHKEQSLYRNILVTQVGDKRCMTFSLKRKKGQNQSCLLLQQPQKLVFNYTKMSMIALVAQPTPKKVLIIGLGGGSLVNAIHSLAPAAKITSVEIDEAVVRIAKKYFDMANSDWHQMVTKDARVFVKRALLKKQQYDLVVLDAFNGDYIPEHLMTYEFLTEVKRLLSDKGLVIANTFASSKLYDHESVTYHAAFGDFYQVNARFTNNRIIVATNNALPTMAQLQSNAANLAQALNPLDVSWDFLYERLIVKPRWDKKATRLTDDYAPVNLLN